MRHDSRRRPARAHALRLDRPAIWQVGIAAVLAMFVTWLTQNL